MQVAPESPPDQLCRAVLRHCFPNISFRGRITAVRRSFDRKGQALSEVAPAVGGGATTGRRQVGETAEVRNEATAARTEATAARTEATAARTEATAARLIRRVMQASQDLDPLGLQAQLDLAAAVLGLARCVDEIVAPATRQLRRLLATGQRDAAQDLMATEAIRSWLNYRGSFAPLPQEGGPIVLACGPRDRHLVGLESLALLLRFQRWPCRVLGARISTFTLTMAAQSADATGVVVISTESRGLPHAIASLRAVDALGIPVFFAGNAFQLERHRRQLPGRYLGSRMGGACTLLMNTLAPAGQSRSAAVHSPGSEPQ